MSYTQRVKRTYQKQTEDYPNGFVHIVEEGDFFSEKRPKVSLETLHLTKGNTVLTKVSGVAFALWSKWWLNINGYEHKDGRTYERGTQINKEQLQMLIEFLQAAHAQMEQVNTYPGELPSHLV